MTPTQDEVARRRRGLVNAVAAKYGALLAPDLCDALLALAEDPLEAVGRAVQNMREDEIVITGAHLEVR